jgi:hypothetical protein
MKLFLFLLLFNITLASANYSFIVCNWDNPSGERFLHRLEIEPMYNPLTTDRNSERARWFYYTYDQINNYDVLVNQGYFTLTNIIIDKNVFAFDFQDKSWSLGSLLSLFERRSGNAKLELKFQFIKKQPTKDTICIMY